MNSKHQLALLNFTKFVTNEHEKLSFKQLAFLMQVAINPGRSHTELAELLGVTRSAVTRNVDVFGTGPAKSDRHKSLGLVEALREEEDERLISIYLTRRGERFLEDLESLVFS